MLNIQIVLFDGFDLMDAIGPYEVFMAAGMLSGIHLNVNFDSAEGARIVPSGMKGPGLPASGFIDPNCGGILLVPGAMGKVGPEDAGSDAVVTQLLQAKESGLMPLLRQAMNNESMTVSTVCGGAMLLAMDGLLEGRYAVTHVLGMEAFGAMGAKPVPARVVVDGRLVTGGGVTSGLDVALYLVERELGPRVAHAVEKLFEYERRGTVWTEAGLEPMNFMKSSDSGKEKSPSVRLSTAESLSDDTVTGTWDLTISTPVGKFSIVMTLTEVNGAVQGTFQQGDELTELTDLRIQNSHMTWSLSIKKPMRLHLKFDVTVEGDQLSGLSKAGMLPSSKVQGIRRTY
ncbi:DJ-1/PfpI family protein [Paenibacillus sp. OAS669]|uniref:DJ-1/PfpI family protein n=1 Tax=Paenibacillus sp. OAS669 TaxID=2663821 RepID=UPI00178A68AA|nr:DJ-1/PfpI family protein [Paenibacillus sp. OAS669]MBE1442713.1 putative intracellular protease/amidase [Paenibacillus sp. OAS669]